MPSSLFIFAEIKPKPVYFKAAQQAIIDILDQTRAEIGCLAFNLFEAPDQGALYLFEEWQDQDALDHHHAQPYTVSVFEDYKEWLAQPPRILPLHSVG
jgi:quinol monooxygenase YgiN